MLGGSISARFRGALMVTVLVCGATIHLTSPPFALPPHRKVMELAQGAAVLDFSGCLAPWRVDLLRAGHGWRSG